MKVPTVPFTGVAVWAVLLGLYLALISATTWVEVTVGAVFAVAATVVCGLAVRLLDVRLRPPRLRWRWLWTYPYDAARDAVRLAGRLVGIAGTQRERRGWWDDVKLPDAAGDPAATRAYAVLVYSLTPASYVADVEVDDEVADREAGSLRVRRWARKGPVERAVDR